MPRYRLTIEYDGTTFYGWQSQAGGEAVQDHLAAAVFKASGETISVRGAGRTDSGVHALGQVAHIDLAKAWEPYRLREALNFHLKPVAIAVLDAAAAAPDFDARFSATARHYLYRILSRRAPPTLDKDRVWWVTIELDAYAMHEAAQVLVGHHDFTTFRAAGCQANSPMRTLDRLHVARAGAEIHVTASARSFLHNQVRSMVGSLKLVGEGRWTANDLRDALDARHRPACGPVAPAAGLYLTRVDYPGEA
ncbi:MAG: pseudouridine synthase [Alphaproteobacteria bacterium BRH_c36]|nr:MAG: pseudouridine synthase [Alphaproteobacteria bacterium BRH_c36]